MGQSTNLRELLTLRPLSDWHEDDGPVLWWSPPINEPPYVGTPLDLGRAVEVTIRDAVRDYKYTEHVGGWPGYHTHWSPIPSVVWSDGRSVKT